MGYFIGPMLIHDFMDTFLRPSTDESQIPVQDESQMPEVPDDLFAALATATEAQSYSIVVS